MPSAIDAIHLKIKRAHHHIADVDAECTKFLKREPYTILGEIDAQGCPTYRVSNMQPLDPMIFAITGDALQNLRSALDYLACALWSRTNAGDCKVYFPITESAATYKTEGLRKIKGMRQDAVKAISAIEPYQGGNGDILWRLHTLSIIDKHRLPIAVVAANLGIHLPSLYLKCFQGKCGAIRGYWLSTTRSA